MKVEVDKLDIAKMVNVQTSFNNLETNVHNSDAGKLKTVPWKILEKISDVVDNQVVKNTKFCTPETKVNTSEKKISDGTKLIHIIQYNTDKQNLEKQILDVDKNIPGTNGLVTATNLNTKISEVENKISGTSGLVTATVLNTKIREIENKITDNSKYITTQEFN